MRRLQMSNHTKHLTQGRKVVLLPLLKREHISQPQVLPYTIEAQLIRLSCGGYIQLVTDNGVWLMRHRDLLYRV